MQTTRNFLRTISLIALMLLATGCAHKITYKVMSVADGDTITVVRDQATRKIRLAGIDAPEKNQPFGLMAKEFLASLVFGKDVEIQTEKKDRYGRDVGKVLSEGNDVNLKMLVAGLAWHYKKYQSEQSPDDRMRYDRAEKEARTAQRGLWADPNPKEPSDWRSGKRNPIAATLEK
jgi:endonuclease YncB( thermonuclease family)